MSEQPWWSYGVQVVAWFVVMGLIMGWLSRSRVPNRTSNDNHELRHPRALLIIGVVCSGLFLALAAFSLIGPNTTGSPLISMSVSLGFACLGAFLIAEALYVRHRLEPSGLRYRTWTAGRGLLRWDEVARIRYSRTANWFRIDGAQGEVVRVSAMLMSLPEFARAVLETVPPERIDPKAHDVLKAASTGALPPIWGGI